MVGHVRQYWMGLGPCKICSCRAFRGHGNICEECGHYYDEHTTSPMRLSLEETASAVERRPGQSAAIAVLDERER